MRTKGYNHIFSLRALLIPITLFIFTLIFILTFTLTFSLAPPAAADSFDDAMKAMNKQFEEQASTMNTNFEKNAAAMEKAWDEEEKRINEEWERMKREVEQKWDSFLDSSKKVWVDYDAQNQETRSQVDFEKGKVVIEALVPVKVVAEDALKKEQKPEQKKTPEMEKPSRPAPGKTQAQIIQEAKPKIMRQLQKILAKDKETRQAVLADQIETKQGKIVDEKNAPAFIQKEVLPKAFIEGESFQGKDGVERIKVKVELPLVPMHLIVRAKKYQDHINKYAEEYTLDPRLLYSVIETESYFNAKAKSPAGAYGLMQLIPRWGAREAYQYLYNKDIIVPKEQLYIPGVNICLGSAYLKLLKERYYGHINDTNKNQYLSIASYNWGPTAVKAKIVNRCDLQNMEHQELFSFIRKNSPPETSDYLKRVTERMPKYQIFLP